MFWETFEKFQKYYLAFILGNFWTWFEAAANPDE